MLVVNEVSYAYFGTSYVLNNVSIEIPDKSFIIISGQSGSGKTTLLNVMAGLQAPSKGEVVVNGVSLYKMKPSELTLFRSKHVGFVFQNYFLEKRFSAYENVCVPLFLNHELSKEMRVKIAGDVLGKVGLYEKMDRKPGELSGGECQRVSIARALANNPELIFADEPTGNLDTINGNRIIDLLYEQKKAGKTVVMVTHNDNYLKYADKVFRVVDGNIC